MNPINNVRFAVKLVGGYLLIAAIIAVVAVIGFTNMQRLNANIGSMYDDRLLPVQQVGDIATGVYRIRGDVYKYISEPTARALTEQDIQTQVQMINANIGKYKATQMTEAEKNLIKELDNEWPIYDGVVREILQFVKDGKTEEANAYLLDGGKASNARKSIGDILVKLSAENSSVALSLHDESNSLFQQSAAINWVVSGIGLLLAIVIGVTLSNSISGPLAKVVYMIQEMSLGHLGNRLRLERKDEVGILAQTMDSFAEDLQTLVVANMKKIAEGNLNFEAPMKDARDEIGPALRQTVESLRGTVTEVSRLTRSAVEGHLSVRADASRFSGSYHEIVQGVNDTLDAVIGPINVSAEYMERIAKGDIPNRITDTYHGDFNEIKNNLNICIDAINALVDDTSVLSQAALNGQLSMRADVKRHQGNYRQIVQGINETLDAVINPLNVAAEYVDRIARGEIPGQITTRYKGDFDVLKNNLNRLSDRLREMLTALSVGANNLNTAAAEILSATTQQASGASEQSASISQTTTTVQEVKAISEQSSNRAQEVATASQRTVEVSRAGQKAMQDTIESMAQIKERVESIAENILALSDQTQQIGEIIATVNEIASQSNMLALNASVEAARAGEHGKGFAVVAMEVRSLAEASKQATAQVKSILSEIQKATNTTVMATEEGTKGVEKGVQLAAQARESIEQLGTVINESAQIAVQMMAGGQQQLTGIEQIALAMQNINQVTVQSLASTRQAEKSAQNLNDLARNMSATVNQYRTN